MKTSSSVVSNEHWSGLGQETRRPSCRDVGRTLQLSACRAFDSDCRRTGFKTEGEGGAHKCARQGRRKPPSQSLFTWPPPCVPSFQSFDPPSPFLSNSHTRPHTLFLESVPVSSWCPGLWRLLCVACDRLEMWQLSLCHTRGRPKSPHTHTGPMGRASAGVGRGIGGEGGGRGSTAGRVQRRWGRAVRLLRPTLNVMPNLAGHFDWQQGCRARTCPAPGRTASAHHDCIPQFPTTTLCTRAVHAVCLTFSFWVAEEEDAAFRLGRKMWGSGMAEF